MVVVYYQDSITCTLDGLNLFGADSLVGILDRMGQQRQSDGKLTACGNPLPPYVPQSLLAAANPYNPPK